MGFQITIDGPSGCGKSTVARILAKKLGYVYIDTGAMYRAVGLHILNKKIDFEDIKRIEKELDNIKIDITYKDFVQKIYLDGVDVTNTIRSQAVADASSKVATIKDVREKLVSIQRDLAKDNDVIMDGRDIGYFVLPDANVKIYLDASEDIRASRRVNELKELGVDVDIDEIKNEIQQRDFNDMNREHSPLKKADDAIFLDTSNMDIDHVVEAIIDIVKERS